METLILASSVLGITWAAAAAILLVEKHGSMPPADLDAQPMRFQQPRPGTPIAKPPIACIPSRPTAPQHAYGMRLGPGIDPTSGRFRAGGVNLGTFVRRG